MVHHGLEGGGRVGKSEEHYPWLKKPKRGDEGCFPLVPRFDSYIVVAPSDIEFSEQGSFSYCCDEVWDEGERIAVLDRVVV
jgi:hypothetical protein